MTVFVTMCLWQVLQLDSAQSVAANTLIVPSHMLHSVCDDDIKCATSLASLRDLVDILQARSRTDTSYNIHRVPKKVVHQAHIHNLVNSQRIFTIPSLAHSGKCAIQQSSEISPHPKRVAALPCEI